MKLTVEKSADKSFITMEKIISTTEISSKVNKPVLYKKVISDPIDTR